MDLNIFRWQHRKVFGLWCLLPFPLLNLLLPLALCFMLVGDVQSILRAFGILPATAISFPSQSQMVYYGPDYYRSATLTNIAFALASLLLWAGGLVIMRRLDSRMKEKPLHSVIKSTLMMSALSFLSVLCLLIGMDG